MLSRNVIMIDLETMGVEVNSPIIQIGAIAWDLKEGQELSTFNQIISLKAAVQYSGLSICPDTLGWWLDRRLDLLSTSIKADRAEQSEHTVLKKFHNWITPYILQNQKTDFLCYGASFDFPMLAAAYKRNNLINVIHYRREQCLRTIFHINGFDITAFNEGKEATHDALEDCHRQLMGLQYLVDNGSVKISEN